MIEAIIKEGGTTRVFANRAKLEVSLQAGGTTFFVPESETRLTTKRIEENGVYKASDDGDYGWSTVTVAVSTTDSVTGTGADGKEHNYSVDGSGALVDQVVPSEIRITTPPNTLEYSDGDTIDFTGIVVHAYDSLGGDMGVVPFNELVFPVTVASAAGEQQPEYGASYSDTSALNNPEYLTQPLTYIEGGDATLNTIRDNDPASASTAYRQYMIPAGVRCVLLTQSSGLALVFMSESENMVVTEKWRWGTWDYYETVTHALASTTQTVGGKTIYYKGIGIGIAADTEVETSFPQNANGGPSYIYGTGGEGVQDVATIVFDGASTIVGGGQEIPVEWSRPGDGLVLDTSYRIVVDISAGYGGATGGGGGTSGGGAGRN